MLAEKVGLLGRDQAEIFLVTNFKGKELSSNKVKLDAKGDVEFRVAFFIPCILPLMS